MLFLWLFSSLFVCFALFQFSYFTSLCFILLLFFGWRFLIRGRKSIDSNGRESVEDLGGIGGTETIVKPTWKKNLFSINKGKKREGRRRSYQCFSCWPNICMITSPFKIEQERVRKENYSSHSVQHTNINSIQK